MEEEQSCAKGKCAKGEVCDKGLCVINKDFRPKERGM
jgi:hypothetical protein